MKIGVNSRIYQTGLAGISNFTENLYKKLLAIDTKNKYLFFQTSDHKKIGETRIIRMPQNLLSAFLFDNLFVSKLIDREKVQVFHGPSNILPCALQKSVKYVLTVHDLSFLIFPKDNSPLFNIYYKYVLGRSLKRADITVADSQNTKEDIKRFYGIADSKIKVAYLGINDIFFSKKKLRPIIQGKYFLGVAGHPKRKNIEGILKVFADNKQSFRSDKQSFSSNGNLRDYKFVVVGTMTRRQNAILQRKILELGLGERVVLFGYATEEELVSLYQNAEFLIYPSFYEGFGFPVLEAMAARCPVIASNVSSLPEIVPSKDWLVDPHNLENISDTINKLLNLSSASRGQLIEENFRFAKKFTWRKTAEKYMQIFSH